MRQGGCPVTSSNQGQGHAQRGIIRGPSQAQNEVLPVLVAANQPIDQRDGRFRRTVAEFDASQDRDTFPLLYDLLPSPILLLAIL